VVIRDKEATSQVEEASPTAVPGVDIATPKVDSHRAWHRQHKSKVPSKD